MESPADDSVRGAPPPLPGEKLVRDKVREVWGSKSSSVDSNLFLPRPIGSTPLPSRNAESSSASPSASSVASEDYGVYVTKPPVGHGQLLLRFLRQHEVPKPPDSKSVVESKPQHASTVYSPPHFERESVGEWSDVDDKCPYNSWEELRPFDDADTDCFSDVEPDSPAAAVVVDNANATVPREPVRDAILPSVAIHNMVRDEQNAVEPVPIVISDDLVATDYIQEVLDTPEDDWPVFDDLTFGLSDINGGHDEGEVTLEPGMDTGIPILATDDITHELGERVPVPQDEISQANEGNESGYAVTTTASEVSITNSLYDLIMQGTNGVVMLDESLNVETASADVQSVIAYDDGFVPGSWPYSNCFSILVPGMR